MAIPFKLIGQGIAFIQFVLSLIFEQEGQKGKIGDDKHNFVQGYVEKWLADHGITSINVDNLITDIVYLLKKHEIFRSGDDEEPEIEE